MARGIIRKGAMIGGTFISEKEYRRIIEDFFDDSDNVIKIRNILNNIIKAPNPKKIYENVEKLETELFKNPTVSLMVITNLSSSTGEYTWKTDPREGRVIKDSGAIDYTKIFKKNIFESEISKILSNHLLEMINMIEQTKLSNEEIDTFFDKYYMTKADRIKYGKRAHDNRKLEAIMYGGENSKGQMADAFLNHLGNLHRNLFTQGFNSIKPFTKSVMEEEGPHFLQLLIDSKNPVPWHTGGDLILVDKNVVIANIQLKTILQPTGSNQIISTENIVDKAQKLRDYIEKGVVYNKEVFSEIMWKTFNTTAIFDKVNAETEKEAVAIARKALGLK